VFTSIPSADKNIFQESLAPGGVLASIIITHLCIFLSNAELQITLDMVNGWQLAEEISCFQTDR
jgi:hypothetical protein